MASLGQLVDLLATSQSGIAEILNDIVNVLWQHESSIGEDLNDGALRSIEQKITSVATIDPSAKDGLKYMANSPFATPELAPEPAPTTPPEP